MTARPLARQAPGHSAPPARTRRPPVQHTQLQRRVPATPAARTAALDSLAALHDQREDEIPAVHLSVLAVLEGFRDLDIPDDLRDLILRHPQGRKLLRLADWGALLADEVEL